MLELRPSCENCDKALPPHSEEAMICTFECTFCSNCVEEIMKNVCPNCGGGFEKRPIRPKNHLVNNPAQKEKVYKPIDKVKFEKLRNEKIDIPAKDR